MDEPREQKVTENFAQAAQRTNQRPAMQREGAPSSRAGLITGR